MLCCVSIKHDVKFTDWLSAIISRGSGLKCVLHSVNGFTTLIFRVTYEASATENNSTDGNEKIKIAILFCSEF